MRYRYRSEEELKDSGVEWIGKIPKEWKVSRIDKEFKVRNEKVSDKEYPPLSVTKRGVLPQLENVAKSDNSDNRKKVCVGDFVINSRADRKGSCGVSTYDGSVSLICNVLTPKRIHSQYVHSLFRNYYFSEEFYRWGSGIVDDLWSTNIEKMKKINIPIPSNNEDEKIANFLDEKTSQFDLIISKKEKLIERLEEAKKSLISEVVTGKVKVVKTDEEYELVKRSNEEMKDSGVEWLGEIPNDWDYLPLKYLAKMSGGYAFSSDTFKDNGVQIIKIANLYNNKLSLGRQPNFVDTSYLESHKDFIVSKGDILISLTGTLGKRDYGYSIMLEDQQKFLLNQRVGKIKYNSNVNINYGIYILQSEPYLTSLYSLPTGTKQANLSNEHVLSIKVTLPDMDEQNKIVEYLDLKIGLINKNKYNILNQIEKLKEAKQSLISEAVTGKIEILD